jgi:hypothetical protein
MEEPISFWGYKEQESHLILPNRDDDDDNDDDDMNQSRYHYELNGIWKRKTESVQHV